MSPRRSKRYEEADLAPRQAPRRKIRDEEVPSDSDSEPESPKKRPRPDRLSRKNVPLERRSEDYEDDGGGMPYRIPEMKGRKERKKAENDEEGLSTVEIRRIIKSLQKAIK